MQVNEFDYHVHEVSFLLWKIAEWIGMVEMMSSVFLPAANSVDWVTSLLLVAVCRSREKGGVSKVVRWYVIPKAAWDRSCPNGFETFRSQMNNISKE